MKDAVLVFRLDACVVDSAGQGEGALDAAVPAFVQMRWIVFLFVCSLMFSRDVQYIVLDGCVLAVGIVRVNGRPWPAQPA